MTLTNGMIIPEKYIIDGVHFSIVYDIRTLSYIVTGTKGNKDVCIVCDEILIVQTMDYIYKALHPKQVIYLGGE